MKNFAFSCVFAFFCISTVFSQGWFIGGDVSFQRTSDNNEFGDGNKTTLIGLSPAFGFIINHKFDMGFNPSFNFKINPGNYPGNDIAFGIGAFARFSIFEISNFSILGRLGFNYSYSSSYQYKSGSYIGQLIDQLYDNNIYYSNYNGYNNITSHIFSISISPVFQFNLTDNLSLFTSIGSIYYAHGLHTVTNSFSVSSNLPFPVSFFPDQNYSSNNFGLNISNSITLGFNIVFGSSRSTNNENLYSGTFENQNNSQKQSRERNQSRESRQSRESIPVPQLGEPNLLQMALNRLPAIPIAGNNLKFQFGGDVWVATVNGENFSTGTIEVEDTIDGSIFTLRQTHIWPGAIGRTAGRIAGRIPGGAAVGGVLDTAGRITGAAVGAIEASGQDIVLEYKAGPPSSLRLFSGN